MTFRDLSKGKNLFTRIAHCIYSQLRPTIEMLIANSNSTPSPLTERNVEIKARIGSDEEFTERVEIARKLSFSKGELIEQRDVFFHSQTGRLKLRYLLPPSKSLLVYYERPDVAGPKLSKFNKTEVAEPELLEKILTQTNGAKGILAKTRLLFWHGQTRIHLDKVNNLGNFMEFEVVLKPDQSIEDGQAIANELMQIFKIKAEDLMTGSYFDELMKRS